MNNLGEFLLLLEKQKAVVAKGPNAAKHNGSPSP